MELKAHFSNIHKVIIDRLEPAQSEIVAAIAWFTDRDIFEVLCKKACSGIKVSVALIGDEINQGPGGLNFQKLGNFGGKVSTMHYWPFDLHLCLNDDVLFFHLKPVKD